MTNPALSLANYLKTFLRSGAGMMSLRLGATLLLSGALLFQTACSRSRSQDRDQQPAPPPQEAPQPAAAKSSEDREKSRQEEPQTAVIPVVPPFPPLGPPPAPWGAPILPPLGQIVPNETPPDRRVEPIEPSPPPRSQEGSGVLIPSPIPEAPSEPPTVTPTEPQTATPSEPVEPPAPATEPTAPPVAPPPIASTEGGRQETPQQPSDAQPPGEGTPPRTEPEQGDRAQQDQEATRERDLAQAVPAQPTAPGQVERSIALPPPPAAIPIPRTRLEELFRIFISQEGGTDAIEQNAAALAGEVFNEDDLIRAKVWELRNLIQEFAEEGPVRPPTMYRLHLLDESLRGIASDRRFWSSVGNVAAITSLSVASGVLGGLHVLPPSLSGTARFVGEQGRRSLASLRQGVASVLALFPTSLRRLSTEEKLARDLSALGVEIKPVYLRAIKRRSFNTYEEGAEFLQTNFRNLRMAVMQTADAREGTVYFLFQLAPNRWIPRQNPKYVRSANFTDQEAGRILSQLKATSTEPLVEVAATGAEGAQSTRVRASRFPTIAGARAAFNEATQRLQRARAQMPAFDTRRALEYGGVTAGLLTTGYAISRSDNLYYSDAYLQSLFGPASELQP